MRHDAADGKFIGKCNEAEMLIHVKRDVISGLDACLPQARMMAD